MVICSPIYNYLFFSQRLQMIVSVQVTCSLEVKTVLKQQSRLEDFIPQIHINCVNIGYG